MIRALAAIVVPPHLSASGAARAGERLSAALAESCNMSVANMGQYNGSDAGCSPFSRVIVQSRLPPLLPWTRIPNRFRTLFYSSDISSHVCRGNYDLVHLHNPIPALEMLRIARACRAIQVPYVVSTHGFNEIANGGDIYGFDPVRRLIWGQLVVSPVRAVVRNASAVFALSPADVPLVRGLGFDGADIPIVCNGVDLPADPDPRADRTIYERFGISPVKDPSVITCFFLANHTPNKGLPILLAAFASLKRPYLLIVGGETRPQVPYDDFAKACGPDQRIVTTGRLSDEEVSAMFRRADLFVFPTLADTLPLVVLEAMAHGTPVIASDVGGIPHQLADGAGVLVKPGNAAELAAAVERLADAPRRREAMARVAQESVRRRFTWGAAAAEAMAGYERVLRAHRRSQTTSKESAGSHVSHRPVTRKRAIP